MRTGLIAKKVGMSNYYSSSGENIPVTLLQVSECKIIDRHESSDPNTDNHNRICIRALIFSSDSFL